MSQSISVEQALSQAKKAAKKGNVSQAVELYEAILRSQPAHPVAKKALGKLQKANAGKMVGVEPPQADLLHARTLFQKGMYIEAEKTCLKLTADYPDSLNAFDLLVGVQLEQGKMSEVVVSYDHIIKCHPALAEAYNNRGVAKKFLGEFQAATSDFRKAVELKPTFAEAYRNLSTITKFRAGDKIIEDMSALLGEVSMADSDRVELHFALGKAYEDIAEYDNSFTHYAKGNLLRKQASGYEIENDRMLVTNIMHVFSYENRVSEEPETGDLDKHPIFVLGMPRSGTTLVEQILASHSRVHGAGELDAIKSLIAKEFPQLFNTVVSNSSSCVKDQSIRNIRKGYLAFLHNLKIKEDVVVDKMPLNFLWVGYILMAFPGAKIIHIVRDPIATAWSIYKHYFTAQGNAYAHDLKDIAEFYQLYNKLMNFWHQQFPGRIYDLNYERLTENQEEESRKMVNYCGLAWEEQCLDFHATKRAVRTASTGQVQKKMYQGSSEAWKRYEKHLVPLVNGIKEPYRAKRFNGLTKKTN